MKKRFSKKVDTFMINTTLKMYLLLEDYINNHVITGDSMVYRLDNMDDDDDNAIDYNDPELFFYCVIDKTYVSIEEMIEFIYNADSDTEYEFEINWKKDEAWTEMIRENKINNILS
jgi:hypothetical protein